MKTAYIISWKQHYTHNSLFIYLSKEEQNSWKRTFFRTFKTIDYYGTRFCLTVQLQLYDTCGNIQYWHFAISSCFANRIRLLIYRKGLVFDPELKLKLVVMKLFCSKLWLWSISESDDEVALKFCDGCEASLNPPGIPNRPWSFSSSLSLDENTTSVVLQLSSTQCTKASEWSTSEAFQWSPSVFP